MGGNVNITFGNGDNDFQVFLAPGGTVNWLSGNGTNTLTLGHRRLRRQLHHQRPLRQRRRHAGARHRRDDQLSGFIDFGGDSVAGDTLTVNSGVLSPNLVIMDLP